MSSLRLIVVAQLVSLAFSSQALLAQTAARTEPDIYAYLSSHETKDPVLSRAAQAVRLMMPSIIPTSSASLDTVDIFVTEFGDDLPPDFTRYRTDNCIAVQAELGLKHPSIICSARYLAEAEMVIRRFEDAGELLQREAALLRFVKLSAANPQGYLSRLRSDQRLASTTDQSIEHIGLHLTLALLFFSSHELGHLLDGKDFNSYTNTVSETDPSEKKLRTAVVKMCRHADEFARYGFGLPGLEMVTESGSDVRSVEEKFRQEIVDTYAASQRLFQNEERADAFAIQTMLRYLAALDQTDPAAALEQQHLLLETLFVLGIYKWHKDYVLFTEKTCGRLENSMTLAVCMMQGRERYIEAGALFGQVHRFVFLRTVLAMQEIIKKRMNYFDLPADQRTIWPKKADVENPNKIEALHTSWRFGDLQRFVFLSIIMDTPVKFAYTACATGWFKEIDKKRGSPQLFMMTFEPIERALQRMLEFP